MREQIKQDIDLIEILFYLKKKIRVILFGFAPIFPDTCYHLPHHWPTAATLRTPHCRVLRFKSQHPGELTCFIRPVA